MREEGEDVVFGDVIQFVAIEGAGFVDDGGAIAFIAALLSSIFVMD